MNTLAFNVNGNKSKECKKKLVPYILELKNLHRLMTRDIKMFKICFFSVCTKANSQCRHQLVVQAQRKATP